MNFYSKNLIYFKENSTTVVSKATTKESTHSTSQVTTTSTAVKYVKCLDPSSHIGEKIHGESGIDGVGLIKQFCSDLKSKSPFTDWLRGENV
jgi:hypothetical protein